MKKKIFSAVCALLLVMGAASPLANAGGFADLNITASAEGSDEYRGFGFRENKDGTFTLSDFYDHYDDNNDITIPSTYEGKKVTSIGDSAFSSCSSLKSITIPDTVTSIGDCAFWGCSSLKSINIPNGVTSIGSWTFYECTSLESVTLPDTVTSIGYTAFNGCESLKSINIPDGVTSIGEAALCSCKSLESLNLPNTLTSIGDAAFSGCSSLTSITIPNGVTSIGNYTFEGCTSLKTINIPSTVTSMYKEAFDDSSSIWKNDALVSINVDENNPAFSSVDGVLYNKDKTEMIYCPRGITILKVPSSVTNLGNLGWFWDRDAFERFDVDENNPNYSSVDGVLYNKDKTELICCPNAKESITIPSSTTKLDVAQFSSDALKSINVDANNPQYTSVDGVLYNKDKTEILRCPKRATSITIPNSVTSINEDAFSGCASLESITIPNGVTSIGEKAFRSCTSLKSLTIPKGVVSIENSTFSNCVNLSSITIPNGVISIGRYAFCNCASLESVNIPDSVTTIDEHAFDLCKNLKSITIPSSVKSIGNYAFYDCPELKSVTITGSATEIGKEALGYLDYEYKYSKQENLTIYVKEGSKAKTYAIRNGFKYVVINIGDVNGDGKIDIEDAVLVINHVNGQKALTDDEVSRADIDGNSDIDIEDAVAIIAHVNGVKSID